MIKFIMDNTRITCDNENAYYKRSSKYNNIDEVYLYNEKLINSEYKYLYYH